MRSYIALALSILMFSELCSADRSYAYFIPESVVGQEVRTTYIRIDTSIRFGLRGEVSKAKCAVLCLHENNCNNVYKEHGACVFGLTLNAEGFEGEVVTLDTSQVVQVKREFI